MPVNTDYVVLISVVIEPLKLSAFDLNYWTARVLRAYFARDIVSQLKKLFEHILIISDS